MEIKFNEKKEISVHKTTGDEINYSRNIAKRLQEKVKSKEQDGKSSNKFHKGYTYTNVV